MEVIEYTIEELIDPTGILSGRRFEFLIVVMLDPDDELFEEKGTGLRVLHSVEEEPGKIAAYHFFDRATGDTFDFQMEDEEFELIEQFCQTHYEE